MVGAIKSREGRNWERRKIEEKKDAAAALFNNNSENNNINSPEIGGAIGSPNPKVIKEVRSRTKLSFVVKQETIKPNFDGANRVIAKHKTVQINKTPADSSFN